MSDLDDDSVVDYWLPQAGRAHIKLVDDRGRTLCTFRWYRRFIGPDRVDTGEESWIAENKPQSQKARRQIMGGAGYSPAHITPSPVKIIDGQRYLRLPGGTDLLWNNVTAVLDAIAKGRDADLVTLTVAQLRARAH